MIRTDFNFLNYKHGADNNSIWLVTDSQSGGLWVLLDQRGSRGDSASVVGGVEDMCGRRQGGNAVCGWEPLHTCDFLGTECGVVKCRAISLLYGEERFDAVWINAMKGHHGSHLPNTPVTKLGRTWRRPRTRTMKNWTMNLRYLYIATKMWRVKPSSRRDTLFLKKERRTN